MAHYLLDGISLLVIGHGSKARVVDPQCKEFFMSENGTRASHACVVLKHKPPPPAGGDTSPRNSAPTGSSKGKDENGKDTAKNKKQSNK
jgi:hypothetical protein